MSLTPVRARRTIAALFATALIPGGLYAGTASDGARTTARRTSRHTITAPARQDSTRLSDANILAQEIGGDSAEVAISRYVEGARPSPAVRAYATMLITDHSKSMRETQTLARQLSVTPASPPGDTTAQETAHVIAHLRTLQGRALDTAFVQHEVMDHEHDIAEAHRMAAAAHNPRVRTLVQQSLPVLQKHLERARRLAR